MIQETLDYLLTRQLLVSEGTKELIDLVDSKETFARLVHTISYIMQKEFFIGTSKSLEERVADFIHHFRFDYNKDKELNDEMNFIIGRLQEYKALSQNRARYLFNEWVKQEINDRSIPNKYQNYRSLIAMITIDGIYMVKLLDDRDGEFVIDDNIEFLSLLNLLLNRFPKVFEEDHYVLEMFRKGCEAMLSVHNLPTDEKSMAKRTLKQLNKKYQVSDNIELGIEYQLVKKKTEN